MKKTNIDFPHVFEAITNSIHARYFLDVRLIPPEKLLIYTNEEKFNKLCKEGCVNYAKKWSCPPFAPHYVDFVLKWETLVIFYFRIDMAQFSYIKHDHLKIKVANTILKSRSDRFLRNIAKYGSYISSGSCRLCKPCKCKLGQPCAHRDNMTYSFEAMGIDINQLVNDLFQKQLLWYSQNNFPEYTSVICGLLTNDAITIEDIYKKYSEYTTTSG